MHPSERNSSADHFHSVVTWGRRSPRAGPCATIRPSRPIEIAFVYSFGFFTVRSSGWVRRDTSTTTRATSSSWRGGNLGSSHAPSAAFTSAFTKGKNGEGDPMHPRRGDSGCVFSVTNAPTVSLDRSGTPEGRDS